jgi:hypothetical protein
LVLLLNELIINYLAVYKHVVRQSLATVSYFSLKFKINSKIKQIIKNEYLITIIIVGIRTRIRLELEFKLANLIDGND